MVFWDFVRTLRVIQAGLVFIACAGGGPAFAQTFTPDCSGCHAVSGARVNGANAGAVITAANGANGMGLTGGQLAAVNTYASEITSLLGGSSIFTASTRTVAYQGAANSLTVPNVVLSGVITSYGGSATYGTVGGVGTTALTYTHTANHCGNDTVTAFGQGLANTANRFIPISITPPTITAPSPTRNIAYSTSATNLSLGGTANVSSITITGSPANGSAGVVNTNTLSYTSSASTYNAQVTITYRGEGPGYGTANSCGSQNGTVTVNVSAPPAPSVSNVGSIGSPLTVSSVSATNIDVTSNISGVIASNPAATYAVSASQPTAGGSGSSSVSGNIITYTPPGGFTGATTITYTKAGPGGASNTGTIYLNVSAAPTVAAASAITAYNTPVSINLASSITSGTAVTSVAAPSQTNGVALVTGTTTIQFTPTNGFFGTGTFSYTATNVGGTSGTATVTVTVNPPPPTVSAATATVPYNTATPINLASSIGPGGAAVLSVTPSGAVGGTAVATGPSTVTFTPTSGTVGPASFSYSATNAGGTSAGTATVSVTISAPTAPTAGNGSVNVFSGSTSAIFLSAYVSGIYSSASIVSPPSKGTATLSGTTVSYTPNPGYLGTDSFTYNATGVGGTSGTATISLNIVAIPTTPAITRVVAMNKTLTLDVSGIATGSYTGISVNPPSNGTASVNGKVITYIPKTGFSGKDTFTYLAVGGPVGNSTPGIITVDVLPLPTGKDATLQVALNTAGTLDLASLLTGTAIARVEIQTPPQSGKASATGTSVTYTPAKDYFGTDTFTYIAVDTLAGNSLPATVTVTVIPEFPKVKPLNIEVKMNGSVAFNLADFITGSAITGVDIVEKPAKGIVITAGTTITYTPTRGVFGGDSFTYVAFGVAGKSTPGIVTVKITGEPNPADNPSVSKQAISLAQAAIEMSAGQMANITRHLEKLRAGSSVRWSVGFGNTGATAAGTAGFGSASTQAGAATAAWSPPTTTMLTPGATQLPVGNAPAALPLSAGITMAANDLGLAGSPLFALAAGLAENRSVDLGVLNRALAGDTMNNVNPAPTKVWMEGVVRFGQRDASGGISGASFSSSGITMGVDKTLSEKTTVGMSLGYAQDTTNIGTDGSRNQSKGYSLALYGSYLPSKSTFVEGLVGIGGMDFDSKRYVEPVAEFANSTRKGYQYFGSIGGGYESHSGGTLISPYARVEYSSSRLGEVSEAGAGSYALTYFEQTSSSAQGVLGLRGEAIHSTPFGWAVPRARVEWRQDLRDSADISIAYADQAGGTRYSIPQGGTQRSALVWGIGSDFLFRDGWSLGLDYQLSRVSAIESSFAFRMRVTKELGAKGLPKMVQPLDQDFEDDDELTVDAGYTWDDNISRGKVAGDIQSDNIYSINVSKTKAIRLGSNTRLLVTGAAGGERFQNFNGLSRYTLTGEATFQYRSSSEFDAPTWGLFAKVTGEDYQSALRDGYRYSAGLSVSLPLTDRITVFGALSGNNRRSNSEVFRTPDTSARFNIDYALRGGATLYLSGEYRKGDIFSSGLPSLENISVAKMFVQDDAFAGAQYVSYRLEANTTLTTLGYNLGLGARDSIDIAWRRVQSTPGLRPVWVTSPTSYVTNQFSASYLMRF